MIDATGLPAVAGIASWLLTYLVHSTVLLGAAALLGRFVLRSDAWREALWKAALAGGLLTATVQTAAEYRPLVGRFEVAGLAEPAVDVRSGAGSGVTSPDAAGADRDAGAAADVAGGNGATQRAARPATGAGGAPSSDAVRGAPVPEVASASAASRPPTDAGAAPGASPDTGSGAALWPLVLVGLWAVAALVLLVRLAIRHLRLRRLLADRRQVEEGGLPGMLAELRRNAGIWRPVWLAASPRCPSPLALGTREICVPERFITELEVDAQRGALAHELGHLARRDPVWHIGAGVIESVFFFQPLNRLARLRLRETAEHLCDDWAVRQTGSQLGLARCLAEVASWVAPRGEAVPSGTMAMAEGGSPLLSRVERLLNRGDGADASPASSALVRGLVAAGLVLLVAGAAPAVTSTTAPSRAGADPAFAGESGGSPASTDGAKRAGEVVAPEPAPEPEPESVKVVRAPDPKASFAARRAWAERAAVDAGDRGYWLGYVVSSLVPVDEFTISDSEGWRLRELDGVPIARVLGVERDVAGAERPAGSAVVMLFRLRNPRTGPVRIERVTVRSPSVGMPFGAPVYWLGPVSADESFEWLWDIYEPLDGVELPATVLEAVAVHPAEGVVRRLVEVIGDAGADRVRASAAEGLRWHPTDEVLGVLSRAAREDASEDVRRQAIEAIGNLDHAEANDVLRDLARSGLDRESRREAVESLGHRASSGVVDMLLEVALGDPDGDIARQAAESLRRVAPDRAVPALRAIAWDAAHGDARRQAAETLGDIGTSDALSALDEIVERHDDEDVVFQAVEAIASFPPNLALPRLRRIVQDHRMARARREALDQMTDLREWDRDPDFDPGDWDLNIDIDGPDPGNLDPGNLDPGNLDPGNADPGNADPGNRNSGTIDPGSRESDGLATGSADTAMVSGTRAKSRRLPPTPTDDGR